MHLCLLFAHSLTQDVLIYNRNARSSRRLCNTAAVVAAVEARGLSVAYTEVPASACEQVAALSQPLRFLITPHGAHEARRKRAVPKRVQPLTLCVGEPLCHLAKRHGHRGHAQLDGHSNLQPAG